MGQLIRFLWVLTAMLSVVAGASAQISAEIVQNHTERVGAKLQAVTSLWGSGKTFIGREVVPFEFISQRPNKLRVESYAPLRRVVQAYDGVSAPWISHTEIKGGVPQDMKEADAKEFIENADFDGVLVDHAAKGYSVDYAGEETIDGRAAYKLLVMSKTDSIFFLWVDAKSYEVLKRTVFRVMNGKRVAMDTLFKDFRDIGGVMQPHRVEMWADGRLLYVTITDEMRANPRNVNAETFARPARQP
jgi:outer membrane lipoprotein-sorting protein